MRLATAVRWRARAPEAGGRAQGTPGRRAPLLGRAAALFQVVTRRRLHGGIVLTKNLGVSSWGQTSDGRMVAAALYDRPLHRSVVLNIGGESYRMRTHRARAEATRGALTP